MSLCNIWERAGWDSWWSEDGRGQITKKTKVHVRILLLALATNWSHKTEKSLPIIEQISAKLEENTHSCTHTISTRTHTCTNTHFCSEEDNCGTIIQCCGFVCSVLSHFVCAVWWSCYLWKQHHRRSCSDVNVGLFCISNECHWLLETQHLVTLKLHKLLLPLFSMKRAKHWKTCLSCLSMMFQHKMQLNLFSGDEKHFLKHCFFCEDLVWVRNILHQQASCSYSSYCHLLRVWKLCCPPLCLCLCLCLLPVMSLFNHIYSSFLSVPPAFPWQSNVILIQCVLRLN